MRLVSLTTSNILENSTEMNKNTTKDYSYYMRRSHLTFIKTCLAFLVCICLIGMVSCHTKVNREIDFKQEYNSSTEDMMHEKYNENYLRNLKLEDTNLNDNIHLKDEPYMDYITNENHNEKKHTKRRKHKRIKNKRKHHKNEKNRNNDNISEKLYHVKSAEMKNEIQYIDSDKKYFDYFPIEKLELNSNETDQNDHIKVIFLSIDGDDNKKKQRQHRKKLKNSSNNNQHNRSKRSLIEKSTSQIDSSINKRNIHSNEYEANTFNIEQDIILPKANLIRKTRDNFIRTSAENGQYYSYSSNSNGQWNYRYLKPLNRIQIPGQYPHLINSVPFVKYSIPGIYHNPISPPGNYKSVVKRPPSIPNTPDSVNNRFGDDDEWVWDVSYRSTTRRPAFAAQSPVTRRTQPPLIHGLGTEPPATRRTSPPLIHDLDTQSPATRSTPPPLIHSVVTESPIATRRTQPPPIRDFNQRPTAPSATRRTSPPFIRNPSINTNQGNNVGERRPLVIAGSPIITTTTAPKAELSTCVWAIVSCCDRGSLNIRYSCFEQIGCHGAFWGLNPCAEDIQDEALEAAEKYFNNK